MAFETRDYAGAAVPTTLTGGINSTDLTINIASSTGWPSGGANGPFFVVINRGLAGEEKVEVQSRTGTALTVASTGKRGVDGTSATSHSLGATIEHCFTAQDADEANSHVTNTALDHHTQYLNTTRHDTTSRHDIGSVIPATGTPSTITPDASASNGSSENVARVDHTHAIVAATAVTSGLANAEGVSTSFARADHTHDQAALSVDTAELVDGAVETAKINDDAVTAAKVADGAIDATAKIADGIVTRAKYASEAPSTYTPTVQGIIGGSNTIYGMYMQMGRLVVLTVGFVLGTGGDGDGALIGFTLPPGLPADFTTQPVARYVFGGWANDSAGPSRYACSGTIDPGDPTRISRFVNAGVTLGFNDALPFNWNSGDGFFVTGYYFTT